MTNPAIGDQLPIANSWQTFEIYDMKRLILIVAACVPVLTYSQTEWKSVFYHLDGTLRLDTSYRITPEAFIYWRQTESRIINLLIEETEYHPIAVENGIGGLAIASFQCDSLKGVKNIGIAKSADPFIDKSVIVAVTEIIGNKSKYFSAPFMHDQTLYVPFLFETKGEEDILNLQSIPVIRYVYPVISQY